MKINKKFLPYKWLKKTAYTINSIFVIKPLDSNRLMILKLINTISIFITTVVVAWFFLTLQKKGMSSSGLELSMALCTSYSILNYAPYGKKKKRLVFCIPALIIVLLAYVFGFLPFVWVAVLSLAIGVLLI